jgi:hypothetical protein
MLTPQSAGFLGRFVVELIRDDKQGLWEHQEPFGFRSRDGREYWVKKGHRTDFCSVPRVPFAYDMLGNRARRAGSIHDGLYEELLQDGVSECEAGQFYLAVRMFGASHWDPAPAASAPAPTTEAAA